MDLEIRGAAGAAAASRLKKKGTARETKMERD